MESEERAKKYEERLDKREQEHIEDVAHAKTCPDSTDTCEEDAKKSLEDLFAYKHLYFLHKKAKKGLSDD